MIIDNLIALHYKISCNLDALEKSINLHYQNFPMIKKAV